MLKNSCLLCATALCIASCTMIPKYEQPAAPVPNQYASTEPATQAASQPGTQPTTQSADAIKWRDFFTDPRMKRCIALALDNNRDLRVAALTVERAQAQYRIQRAALYPTVDAGGSYARSRQPASNLGGFHTGPYTSNQYDASIGITSYELDLFGRIRSTNRQAIESFFSQVETQRATQIALVAQVANQYLLVREYEEQLALATQTLQSVQGSYDLTKQKTDVGAAPDSDLASVRVQVESARVKIHQYERLLAQAKNTLVELMGQSLPENLPPVQSLSQQGLLRDIRPGLPSELIARRPDILAAEHTLLAANANIGAARAAFFPKITLTTSAGFSSTDLAKLFSGDAFTWTFNPQISVPIFDGGVNQANLDVSKISKRMEIANYERTIQTAFREVSDALVARTTYVTELGAQESLVQAQRQRYDFATARYNGGVAGYLDVLTAQQDLYSAQETLLSTRAAQLENLVTLYKVLGGGWN